MSIINSTAKIFFRLTALALVVGASVSSPNFSAHASREDRELCQGFLPENDMKVPVGFKSLAAGAAGLTEAKFNAVLDRIDRLYKPVIAQAGGKLKINRLWTDATVNASAQKQGGNWILNMYGGLARHPATTEEGFALVVCHELGHHIGGAPKSVQEIFGFKFESDMTNEGGADYFATLKCLRKYFAEDDNQTIIDQAIADGILSNFAAQACEQEFAIEADQLLCKRGSLGGTSTAGLFQALRKEATPPDYTTPDTKKVTEMFHDHPATQCRMDTYLAGAICNVDASVANSDKDYRQGSCVENVAKVGFRPRCWFAP